MNEQRRRTILHYSRRMKSRPAKTGTRVSIPVNCKKCQYYQPDFRYRICTFVKCRYGLIGDVFRKYPLKKDLIIKKVTPDRVIEIVVGKN